MAEPSVHTLSIVSPPDDVDSVHDMLESVWLSAPQVSPRDRFSFETALIELASNVIRHADGGAGVSCALTVEITADRIVASLTDSGLAGNISLIAPSMPDELEESGRGLSIIHALVDEVGYDRSDDLNHWRISRKLES